MVSHRVGGNRGCRVNLGSHINEMESEYKTKNREVKRSTKRDKRSHVEKLSKGAEEAAFVGDLGEVYKITKELVNANTKA